MVAASCLEVRPDCLGEKLYASRNSNDFRHTYEPGLGANRCQVDWTIMLRQSRRPGMIKTGGAASAPNLRTSESRENRRSEPLVAEHEDGPYHCTSETLGKYQNFANSTHMLRSLNRVSGGSAHGIDWQLNLRDGTHQKPDDKWKRYFSRGFVSFDMMAENVNKDNEAYHKSFTTPQDRRPDRNSGALPVASIREDPISFRRWPGCEGTQVGQWRHLIEDRRHGHKSKKQMQFESTLREDANDKNGARICDNRSDGCITEMLGKKKWLDSTVTEPLARRPPEGDAKLHYMSRMRIVAEKDEENRQKRMYKQERRDSNIPEAHEGKAQLFA
eukprot:gnl/TRDRNA2_/TRDRNA2_178829_c0_seq1.p1 gnl/TRDRNA2_/TRDRNA2_178829_c0~~gnl/TRDRNA2_/TRDRNA2_178829_c0_seq1.p1  ORF type:complete len:330 (+),score=53.16 gnl/TRDRNA2_/TRDRNA2_178829_c0_seq1:110-1099(+)